MFKIIKYKPEYEDELMELIKQEGGGWKEYWDELNAARHKKTFEKSVTYLAMVDGKVCGYSRSIIDTMYIYICDLLVTEKYRGNELGERLMRYVQVEYPGYPMYIMSGNDEYYKKLGCKREGSIYLFK